MTPSFSEFYREVHGRLPFPWQDRLAEQVAVSGWPAAIAVPTGMGKTACIDVAVWALASQAERRPGERTAPTRIWYVVNRRLLVDAAAIHADRLRHLLLEARPGSATGEVARRLRSIHGGEPLWVSRLRGGTGPGWTRPRTPAQPAVLCATVPMFGSRLLFRAYGSGSGMRPVDAALAGTDSVVLLDESHLSPALQKLADDMRWCDAVHAGVLRFPGTVRPEPAPPLLPTPRDRPVLVELSATTAAAETFILDDTDRSHPIIATRLAATKPTEVMEAVPKSELPKRLAEQTVRLLGTLPGAGVAAVFCNQPSIARAAAAQLAGKDLDTVVLTGQLRDHDAERVRTMLLDPATGAPAGRPVVWRERPLVIVATQTLEVGADLDVDVLVTQAAGVRALVQRFGRLNRLGERPWAQGMIVGGADVDPVYGSEPLDLIGRIGAGSTLDLSPATIATILGEPADEPPYLPELLPHHLWEFAKTKPGTRRGTPPEVFFSGIEDPSRTVSVLWRAEPPKEGVALVPPVHPAEVVEIPVYEAEAFVGRVGNVMRLSDDGSTAEEVGENGIRPGDRLVLTCGAGGYGPQGWDHEHGEAVRDLSPILRQVVGLRADTLQFVGARPGSGLPEDVIDALAGLVTAEDEDEPALSATTVPEVIKAWLEAEGVLPGDAVCEPLSFAPADGAPVLRWRRPGVRVEQPQIDLLDELSALELVALDAHLHHVGAAAASIARALGMADHLQAVVEQAGALHDLGKADRRFQRWLGNQGPDAVAKSGLNASRWEAARQASGWPKGGRHELLSLQVVDEAVRAGMVLHDDDLVRHLIVSHHGHGRPWVPVAGETRPLRLVVDVGGSSVSCLADPAKESGEQPARFRRLCERYGYWGLALMEAVVRQADHLVSEATEVL